MPNIAQQFKISKLAGPDRFELPTAGFEDQNSSTELRTDGDTYGIRTRDLWRDRPAHWANYAKVPCMVEVPGFEPRTPRCKRSVFPIILYPHVLAPEVGIEPTTQGLTVLCYYH